MKIRAVYENEETGLKIIVVLTQDTVSGKYLDGSSYSIVYRTSLMTEANQICDIVDNTEVGGMPKVVEVLDLKSRMRFHIFAIM